jgi:hypothetical protein
MTPLHHIDALPECRNQREAVCPSSIMLLGLMSAGWSRFSYVARCSPTCRVGRVQVLVHRCQLYVFTM